MKTFVQWADSNELPVPFETDFVEKPASEKTTDENRARTGWSGNYPPAYFSAQYPNLWVASRKSSHALDGEHMGRSKK
jgi:hypothetical protein